MTCVVVAAELICVSGLSHVYCGVSLYVVFLFSVLPEWLAVIVAVDRILAVDRPIFYRDVCKRKTAWLPIGVTFAVLAAVGVPRYLYAEFATVPKISCLVSNQFYKRSVVLLGLPAVVILAVLTVILLVKMKAQKMNQNNVSATEKSVS